MVNVYAMVQVSCWMGESASSVFQVLSNQDLIVFLVFETVFHVQTINLAKSVLIICNLILLQRLVKINQQLHLLKIVGKTKHYKMANVFAMTQVFCLMGEYVLNVFRVRLNLDQIVYLALGIASHVQMINPVQTVLMV